MQRPVKLKHIPKGFRTFSTNCGIKEKSLDLGVVFSETVCTSVAFFTKNQVKGEPVKIGQKHYAKNKLQALVVNSKNANVCTGEKGYQNSLKVCQKIADEMEISVESVFPSSTGTIGIIPPIKKICSALDNLPNHLSHIPDFERFAEAIMTTDTFPKYIAAKLGGGSIVGVTKGSGMIEPNMATTLSYFFTDISIGQKQLYNIVQPILEKTFNSLSIDSDMSTSDTLLIMANGLAGKVEENELAHTFEQISTKMTRWLAYDGEGATKLFIVDVEEAYSEEEARRCGKSIINSPLVKTAISRGDPNWGRVYMAIGKTNQVTLNAEKIQLFWGNEQLYSQQNDNDRLSHYLRENEEIYLRVNLNVGDSSWRVYGCDLTEEYIKINASYTT